MVEDLKERLEAATKTIDEYEKRQRLLEKELQEARDKAAQESADAKGREDALKAALAAKQAELEKARNVMEDLQRQYDEAKEALQNANAVAALERAKLLNQIRTIGSELQEAMVLAKHMRETALKAKRDAAGSVSPAKFAELIAQLEEMRNQLAGLTKDWVHEREQKELLQGQMDKNRRQLELERQFLPLLRKVRGPIGPKAKGPIEEGAKKKDLSQPVPPSGIPPLSYGTSPNKLRASQSLGALPGGAAGGGPLAGGRPHGGFQEDMNRFSSTLKVQ
jgi:DNA repair exonuclease SbcCD ATPase subunit